MSATWRLLPRIDAMMFCPEPLVKRKRPLDPTAGQALKKPRDWADTPLPPAANPGSLIRP